MKTNDEVGIRYIGTLKKKKNKRELLKAYKENENNKGRWE